MSYLDSINKVADSKKYAGKNIRTADGTIAYVTADGTAKGYTDPDVYAATAGQHGCPANWAQLTQQWSSIGIPTGSVMAKGQACSKERAYVTAAPPQTEFDVTFYKKEYSDLAAMTDQQATTHWESHGKAEGRLPNGSILKSMTAVGQVGYVDYDTVLHRVPSAALSFGDYKVYKQRSNITGAAMVDCTPSGGINFGDRVVLTTNNLKGAVNSNTALAFGKTSTAFFVRPAPNSTSAAIHYGDTVTLATSITSYSSTCGYWGCSVSFINAGTLALEFGPGGASGGTQLKVVAPTGYTTGSILRYGAPFLLSATLPSPDYAMFQGESLTPGMSIQSANDQYYATFKTNGQLCLYQQPSVLKFSSTITDPSPKRLQINDSGSLVAVNADGVVYWTTDTNGKGKAPYAFAVQNDGRAVLYDGGMNVLWSTGAATSAPATTETVYATLKSTALVFRTVNAGTTFTFTNPDTAQATGCDIASLEQQCGTDCSGFVHNPATNEWQKITSGAGYKITSTLQDVYVKSPAVDLGDDSCTPGAALFVEPNVFSNYVAGTAFVQQGSDQCKSTDALAAADKAYADRMKALYAQAKDYADQYDPRDISGRLDKYAATNDLTETKTAEYKDTLEQLKHATQPITQARQKDDSAVVDRQRKAQFIVWSVALAAVLGLILIVLKKK